MEELIRFKSNDYELCLLYDGKKTYYAKRKNGQITYAITDNDKALIKFVYKKVMPSKNLKPRTSINFAGKTYAHFVDDKLIHVFYELKDNKLFIPEKDIRKQLNYIYNNQEELVYDGKENDLKNKEFFKRLVKIGKKVLVVLVATSTILGYDYLNQYRNVIVEDDVPVIVFNDDLNKDKENIDEQKTETKPEEKDNLDENIGTTNSNKDNEPNPEENIEIQNTPKEENVNLPTNEDLTPPTDENANLSTDEDLNPPTDENVNLPTDDDIIPPTDDNVNLSTDEDLIPPTGDNGNLPTDDDITPPTEDNVNLPTDDDINQSIDNINEEIPFEASEDLLKIAREYVNEINYKQTADYNYAGDDFYNYYHENNLLNEIIKIYNLHPELKDVPILINHQGFNALLTYIENNDGYVISLDSDIFTAEYENVDIEIPKELKEVFPNDLIVAVKERNIELHFEDIAKLLELNPFLSQEEKNFVMSNPKFIIDNLKYMDHNYIFKMLLNLRIDYKLEQDERIGGSYELGEYLININSLDFNSCDKTVLSHELCHAFSCPKRKLSNRYIEIINTIINSEYRGNGHYNYDCSYGELKLEGYALMELIGTEPVIKDYFQCDTKEIKASLMAIINDEAMADELLEILDSNVGLRQNGQLFSSLYSEGKEKFNNLIKSYYEAKYQQSILENEELMYYLYPNETSFSILSKVTNEETALKFKEKYILNSDMVKPKIYFNDNYADNNYPIIQLYRDFNILKEDDNGRFQYEGIDPFLYGLNYGLLEENLQR